jgi:hypothetical protein
MTLDDCLKRLYESDTTFNLVFTMLEAIAILSQLQVALRHPENNGDLSKIATEVARGLQRGICLEIPEIQPILELGWNPIKDLTMQEFERMVTQTVASDDDILF